MAFEKISRRRISYKDMKLSVYENEDAGPILGIRLPSQFVDQGDEVTVYQDADAGEIQVVRMTNNDGLDDEKGDYKVAASRVIRLRHLLVGDTASRKAEEVEFEAGEDESGHATVTFTQPDWLFTL